MACAGIAGTTAGPAGQTAGAVGMANGGGYQEVILDGGFHHLGDNFLAHWIVPDPEGTTLEIIFWLNQGQIQSAKTAHLELFLLQNNWSNVLLNGRRWSLPLTEDTEGVDQLPVTGMTLFSFPKSFLQHGDNSIVFESVPHDGNFDDFELGEIALILSK
ncbi:MAG: hypothetical protein ACYSU7_02385 [Planctomycetota bacterium]